MSLEWLRTHLANRLVSTATVGNQVSSPSGTTDAFCTEDDHGTTASFG